MNATETKTMKVQVTGKSVVMFGSNPETGKWFERYYPTVDAAKKFADKRGWTVEVKESR